MVKWSQSRFTIKSRFLFGSLVVYFSFRKKERKKDQKQDKETVGFISMVQIKYNNNDDG